jgi:hypothetical protein
MEDTKSMTMGSQHLERIERMEVPTHVSEQMRKVKKTMNTNAPSQFSSHIWRCRTDT